jgi:hypothetical protein
MHCRQPRVSLVAAQKTEDNQLIDPIVRLFKPFFPPSLILFSSSFIINNNPQITISEQPLPHTSTQTYSLPTQQPPPKWITSRTPPTTSLTPSRVRFPRPPYLHIKTFANMSHRRYQHWFQGGQQERRQGQRCLHRHSVRCSPPLLHL